MSVPFTFSAASSAAFTFAVMAASSTFWPTVGSAREVSTGACEDGIPEGD
jgi:hypothetical protein